MRAIGWGSKAFLPFCLVLVLILVSSGLWSVRRPKRNIALVSVFSSIIPIMSKEELSIKGRSNGGFVKKKQVSCYSLSLLVLQLVFWLWLNLY